MEPQIQNGSFLQKLRLFLQPRLLGIIALFVIGTAIPLTIYISQRSQNIRQHAATNGQIVFLDTNTNQPIAQATSSAIKLQITIPDGVKLSTPSGKIHFIIPKAYAQTESPTSTPSASNTPAPTNIPTTSPTPGPTVTTTPASKSSPCGSYGDVNNDGVVSHTDAELVFAFFVGSQTPTDEQRTNADVDADGSITPIDGQRILSYLNNQITTFPACPPVSAIPTSSSTPQITATPTPATKILLSIIISNTDSGTGGQAPTTISGVNLVSALSSPYSWTLNPLGSTEDSATRTVTIQFFLSDSSTLTTSKDITLAKNTTSSTPTDTIDVLDYFLTKHPDIGLTGSHPLSQTIEGQKAYSTKWQRDGDAAGISSVFEIYTWDNTNVYLKEDHSGAPVDFYTFNPGRWMKRHMRVGESIRDDTNQIQVYNTICEPVASWDNNNLHTGTFPIEMTLERKDLNFAAGGQLGTQDVIVLKYDSSVGDPNGIFERLYYSREWGLILWEQYSKATNAITANSFFNIIDTHPLAPDTTKACSQDAQSPTPSVTSAPVPTETPATSPTPTGTITPSQAPSRTGTPALTPTATATPAVHPTTTLTPPASGSASFTFSVVLNGIGVQGASGTSQATNNANPNHRIKDATLYLYDIDVDPTIDPTGRQAHFTISQPNTLVYNTTTGRYDATNFNLGQAFTPGTYQVLVKSPLYLRKRIGNLALTAGANTTDRITSLLVGDSNNDNRVDIADYNIYINQHPLDPPDYPYPPCFNHAATNDNIILCDYNNDGRLDHTTGSPEFLDLRIFQNNFVNQQGE